MHTIDPDNQIFHTVHGPRRPHKHRWQALGAHTLHAGTRREVVTSTCHTFEGLVPVTEARIISRREIRLVYQCSKCKALRVKIQHQDIVTTIDNSSGGLYGRLVGPLPKTNPHNVPSQRANISATPQNR